VKDKAKAVAAEAKAEVRAADEALKALARKSKDPALSLMSSGGFAQRSLAAPASFDKGAGSAHMEE
jgi:hypothetical protein